MQKLRRKETVSEEVKKEEELTDETSQNMANRAVEIAGRVTKYVTREIQKEVKKGCREPFLLEDMVLAYAIAMANYSLYSVVEPHQPWIKFEEKLKGAVSVACSHIRDQIDKDLRKKRDAYNH